MEEQGALLARFVTRHRGAELCSWHGWCQGSRFPSVGLASLLPLLPLLPLSLLPLPLLLP